MTGQTLQSTTAIDGALANLQRRRSALERDHQRLDGQVADAEAAIARAVAKGAPGGGIAEARAELRALREERDGVAAALALLGREASALTAERHPLMVHEAKQALADAEAVCFVAMSRAAEAIDAVVRSDGLAAALDLHARAMGNWRDVDLALAELRRVSPADAPVQLQRDHGRPEWGILSLLAPLRAARAGIAGAVGLAGSREQS